MLKYGLITIALMVLPSAGFFFPSEQTDQQLDHVGQKLAEWSSHHQKTIKIKGRPINLAGGARYVFRLEQTPDGPRKVCRGSVIVYWQTPTATAEDNQTIRENLKQIIQQSDCDRQTLLAYIDKLDNVGEMKRLTADRLAEDLKCLGQFEFTATEIK